jgi:hypothetical protein
VLDISEAIEAYQDSRLIYDADGEWRRTLETPQSKMWTIKQSLAHGRLEAFNHG